MTSKRRAELVPVQQGIDTQIAGNLRGRPTRLDHTASASNCGLNFRRRSGNEQILGREVLSKILSTPRLNLGPLMVRSTVARES
jgi:hypothetical protein